MEYADDPDFITEIYDKKEYIKEIYKATLRIQNLLKNDDNTEKHIQPDTKVKKNNGEIFLNVEVCQVILMKKKIKLLYAVLYKLWYHKKLKKTKLN